MPIGLLDRDAPFLLWIGQSGSALREAALAALDPARCAVLRIGNALNAPLTPHRIMLQLASDGAGQAEDAEDDEAGHLLRAMAASAAGRPCLLVLIEQAETLTPAALALLQLLPGLRGAGIPAMQVAFHGTPAFRDLLADSRFRPIRDCDEEPERPPAAPPLPGRRGWLALLGAGGGAALCLAAALLLFRTPSPVNVVPLPAPPRPAAPIVAPMLPKAAPAPVPTEPAAQPAIEAAPTPSIEAPATPTPPPATDAEGPALRRARLFREFNAFVEARGLSGRLSRSDRELLFEQYLASRQASSPAAPSNRAQTTPATATASQITPQTAPAVVVFVRTGHPDAELQAGEDAALLRQQFSDVTLRTAINGPAEPTVRYFRPEDRNLAITIALTLPPTTPDWQVVDLSTAAERPAQPTIEVWRQSAP